MIHLTADFSKKLRPMGKLNGMNNGPLMAHTDHTKEFQEMGVDFVRFHECHAQQANCIEVPFVFPNFDADEFDENSYCFKETDVVIAAAVEQGYEIMYRFGMGTEGNNGHLLFCLCPPDYEKWGRIVIQILKHYNEGWANGFHYNIKWCEIWNEADLKAYWPDSHDEYVKFYGITSKMLREYDPTLKICPSGFAYIIPDKPAEDDPEDKKQRYHTYYTFLHSLLDAVQKENLPMDCFAWHFYEDTSYGVEHRLHSIKEMLAMHGMEDIPLINSEWNSVTLAYRKFGTPMGLEGNVTRGNWDMSQTETMKSAICALASMIVMQQYGNTHAAYYDPDPRSNFCGLYDYDGTPWYHYYAMLAFKMLREGKFEYATSGQTDKVRICASYSGQKAFICITSEDEPHDVQLKVNNLPNSKVNYYFFNEQNPLKKMKTGSFSGRAINLHLPADSAWVLEYELV